LDAAKVVAKAAAEKGVVELVAADMAADTGGAGCSKAANCASSCCC
jgi:hypothetical protein